jgi:integrase
MRMTRTLIETYDDMPAAQAPPGARQAQGARPALRRLPSQGMARAALQMGVGELPHTLRHTWATWMRRYAGADVEGLVATGNWRDRRSAARYAHAVARDEWKRVEKLPAIGPRAKSVQSSA